MKQREPIWEPLTEMITKPFQQIWKREIAVFVTRGVPGTVRERPGHQYLARCQSSRLTHVSILGHVWREALVENGFDLNGPLFLCVHKMFVPIFQKGRKSPFENLIQLSSELRCISSGFCRVSFLCQRSKLSVLMLPWPRFPSPSHSDTSSPNLRIASP